MSDLKSITPEIKPVVLDPNMPAPKPLETDGNKVVPTIEVTSEAIKVA
jgi:hypothetical protein